MLDFISNWNLIRVSGFLAYFLLSLSIMAGLMQKIPALKKQKPLMMELHQMGGWTGVLTVIFHGTLLLVDHYVPYEIHELLIPFAADNAPILSGLGTISFYLCLIVMTTSDFFMKKLGRKLWKNIHLFVMPAWGLATLHGIFIGTDSNKSWAAFVYLLCIILIGILLVYRYFGLFSETKSSKKIV